MREKYTFNFGTSKRILVKGEYETRGHIALKLTAYLFFSEIPEIEKRILRDYRYKPDLLIFGENTNGTWIECGKVALRKIRKIRNDFKGMDIYVFKKNKADARALYDMLKRKGVKGAKVPGINIISFEEGFIEFISKGLRKVNQVTYKKYDKKIAVELNGEKLESKIFIQT